MAFLFGDRVLTPIDGCLLGILRQPSPAPKYGHGFAYILWETPNSAGLYKAIRASRFATYGSSLKNNWGILTEPSEVGTLFAEFGDDFIINPIKTIDPTKKKRGTFWHPKKWW